MTEQAIQGITSKLEHLKEAGVGATWLSPIFKSPMVGECGEKIIVSNIIINALFMFMHLAAER